MGAGKGGGGASGCHGDRSGYSCCNVKVPERVIGFFSFYRNHLYLNDARWGRMFVCMCPYFPFSARVCLNKYHWLANRLMEEGIRFDKPSNAFLKCGNFRRLQELADSLTAKDLLACGQK